MEILLYNEKRENGLRRGFVALKLLHIMITDAEVTSCHISYEDAVGDDQKIIHWIQGAVN